MWCDTCQTHVQWCGWCRGAGRVSHKGESVECAACGGTGKFCKHQARFTPHERVLLGKLRVRYEGEEHE